MKGLTLKESLKAIKTKEPKKKRLGPKTMLTDLTPECKKLWPKFWKKYGTKCKESGKTNASKYFNGDVIAATWSMARLILTKYAEKRNIKAFNISYRTPVETKKVQKRIFNASKTLNTRIKTMINTFTRRGLFIGTKVLKETVGLIVYKRGNFEINTNFSFKIKKDSIAEIIAILKAKGYVKKGKKFVLIINSNKIVFETDINQNKLQGHKVIILTKQQIKSILNLDDITIKNNKVVITELGKHLKKILTNTEASVGKHLLQAFYRIQAVNFDSVFGLDFERNLTEKEQTDLDIFKNSVTEQKSVNLIENYDLKTIRELGTPVYQLHLVRYLIEILDKREDNTPILWLKISENPENYIDPIIIEKEQTNLRELEELDTIV